MNKKQLEVLEEIKLLGVLLSTDLKWRKNTDYITSKAYKKLWIIRRLKDKGMKTQDLIDIYNKQVRSVLEFAVPVWNSKLTKQQIKDIERVQKTFLYTIQEQDYTQYNESLKFFNMESLATRRQILCEKFAHKAANHPKHQKWFTLNKPPARKTRSTKTKYKEPPFNTNRFRDSPIPYLTRILNGTQYNCEI